MGGLLGVVVAAWRRVKRSLKVWDSRLREPLEVMRDMRPSVVVRGRVRGGIRVLYSRSVLGRSAIVLCFFSPSKVKFLLPLTNELVAVAIAGERLDTLVDPLALLAAVTVERRYGPRDAVVEVRAGRGCVTCVYVSAVLGLAATRTGRRTRRKVLRRILVCVARWRKQRGERRKRRTDES